MEDKRYKKVNEIAEQLLEEMVEKNFAEIKERYEKDPYIFMKGFLDSLKMVFTKAKELQDKGEKDPVEYISFSVLYSKLLQKKHGYRIDVWSKDAYLDRKEISCFWETDEWFIHVDEDMKYLEKYLSSNYIPVKDYELIDIYNKYSMYYYFAVTELIFELVPAISDMRCYKEMKREEKVKVVLGEYMDKYITVDTLSDEGE